MEYTKDFWDSLDVDVLEQVLDEDNYELLVDCFTWEYHPYGARYWEEQCEGERELDTFELTRILRHFALSQKEFEVEVDCAQPVIEPSDLAPRRYFDLSDLVQQVNAIEGRST